MAGRLEWAPRASSLKVYGRFAPSHLEPWAWEYVERHIRDLLPGAALFPHIDRWEARKAHAAACKRLGMRDCRMHDARHTFAVRAVKNGAPAASVARQLGHSTTQMVVQVYARHDPSEGDTLRRQAHAAELDRKEAEAREPAAAISATC